MIFDHETRQVSFRQSWLDTYFRCPERGREAIVKPEWDELDGDSALCGTAAHAAIERVINGEPIRNIALYAEQYLDAYDGPGIAFKSFDTMDEVYHHATTCAQAWADDLSPHFDWQRSKSEVQFDVKAFDYRGWEVHLTGTADLAPPVNEVDDWKTSGRPYKPADKQKFAIQPTIYGWAAILGGIRDDVDYSWPMTFRYGVMIRGSKKAKGQIVEVVRTRSHQEWARWRIQGAIDLALDLGFDKPWPTSDEGNFLCSEKWCPWWSICKGAFIAPSDNVYPDQPVLLRAA